MTFSITPAPEQSTDTSSDAHITRCFYSPESGVFTGESVSGPQSWVQAQTRDGLSAFDELVDARSFRVDVSTGALVAYQPPAPPADPLRSFTFDETLRVWRPSLTTAGKWAAVRSDRDKRLFDCDWIVTKSAEAGVAVPTAWRDYRQALRDVPEVNSSPDSIVWPTPPA